MKKVRFESPSKLILRMDERECHSPRPFIEKQTSSVPDFAQFQRVSYSNDPVQRYECSNSSPYPLASKTKVPYVTGLENNLLPSNELDLSMLDASESKRLTPNVYQRLKDLRINSNAGTFPTQVLSSIENKEVLLTDCKDAALKSKLDSFFIRRGNLEKYFVKKSPLLNQFKNLNLEKENAPSTIKKDMMISIPVLNDYQTQNEDDNHYCRCRHCIRTLQNSSPHLNWPQCCQNISNTNNSQCPCIPPQPKHCCSCNNHNLMGNNPGLGNHPGRRSPTNSSPKPQNAVDKKTWAIKKYAAQNNASTGCTEVEKQMNVTKEKREPTVADLFKIIKLQNEQLQLLQEKVDKFITASSNAQNMQHNALNSYHTEKVELQTVESEEHRQISIGVMTSFEMVRTSTVINKVKTKDNAKIQCNRSQISIKEVVKSQPVNLNFLDGITPVDRSMPETPIQTFDGILENNVIKSTMVQQPDLNDDKTLNELSLYNVQVDNATTPLISPEQTMYLDVKDYSDSESSSDHSNVGWTYYNKVMTHVNGMLQDSDMPSSASALYRNTRQQCLQMQIDKTNVSVTKRVKFGDDLLGKHQPRIYLAPTDTSLKMNQLAAKYLNAAQVPKPPPVVRPTSAPVDMSFATRNYMEQHQLIHGVQSIAQTPVSTSPVTDELPRFLDITALKQQHKFL